MCCSVFKKMDDAMKLYPDSDVLVSFASLRSAYESTVEAMQYPQVFTHFLIFTCHLMSKYRCVSNEFCLYFAISRLLRLFVGF